ncbi:MAG: 50S ribosomal protein L23 [bacterium]|nr:50S ribosomal protein L23 [bacterium]
MGILRRKKVEDTKDEDVRVVSISGDSDTVTSAKKMEKKAVDKKVSSTEFARAVLISPIITEKSATLASEGKYVFQIKPDAGRIEVKQAIFEVYGVRPVSVNIQRYRRDSVRFQRRLGKQKAWKKAIVTVPKGKTIDVYEGV